MGHGSEYVVAWRLISLRAPVYDFRKQNGKIRDRMAGRAELARAPPN
jgi:hypothetical protein